MMHRSKSASRYLLSPITRFGLFLLGCILAWTVFGGGWISGLDAVEWKQASIEEVLWLASRWVFYLSIFAVAVLSFYVAVRGSVSVKLINGDGLTSVAISRFSTSVLWVYMYLCVGILFLAVSFDAKAGLLGCLVCFCLSARHDLEPVPERSSIRKALAGWRAAVLWSLMIGLLGGQTLALGIVFLSIPVLIFSGVSQWAVDSETAPAAATSSEDLVGG